MKKRRTSQNAIKSYCTISFNSAGIVTHDGPTEILVSADAQSGRDMAKIFGSLPPEAAQIYAYRSVTENIFGRSILGAVTTVTFGYLEGAHDA